MTETESIDKEPAEDLQDAPTPALKPRSALSNIRRELSDEELASPGAQKLLLDRLDSAEIRIVKLSEYSDKFHESDKSVAVLTESLKQANASEVLYSAALSMGAIFAGLAPSAWDNQPYGWLSLLAGIALMIGAIISKGLRK